MGILSKQPGSVARDAFGSVFDLDADAVMQPLRDEASARAVLWLDGCDPSSIEFDAIRAAALAVGDTECFVTSTEDRVFHDDRTWRVPLSEYPYPRMRLGGWSYGQRNAIYSVSGTWGVMIYGECEAIAGGPPEFIDTLLAVLPEPTKDLPDLWQAWDCDGWRSRVRAMLEHVSGKAQAHELVSCLPA